LVEQAPIIAYEWDFGEPGRWRYLSPQIEGLLGYPAEDYMADPNLWFLQIHHDDRDEVIAAEARSQAASEADTIEYRMRHRAGRVVWVRDIAIVVRDEDGGPFFRGILADITPQKEAEQALESLNEDLERRVMARTAELQNANEELGVAKDGAERASRAKSEFLSRASHELRTPLNAILGFGQLLQMSPLADRDREWVTQILKGGGNLLQLINEVLDISKVQAGNLSLLLEPVSVEDVAAQVVASSRADAEAREIRLDVAASGPVLVLADRQRLIQVLSELLSNGIRFTEKGGVVRIDWSAGEESTSIKVTDTGPGIAAEHLARLFAVFERAESHTPRLGEGTGLGLALAKGLVEAMGGTISVESEVGTGTTMSLAFPSAGSAASPSQSTDERPPDAVASPRDLTILCVEDNAANVALIRQIVEKRPHVSMLWATHGRVGLELAFEHHPNLVLLDIHLPDMAGEDALSQLKSDPRTRHIPVFVVSAETDTARLRTLEQIGVDALVAKPIHVARLLELIDEALKIEAPSPVS
jgi:PAS domain S-box-containing protein